MWGRKRKPPTIEDFWAWWPTARDALGRELDAKDSSHDTAREVLDRVAALGLASEFGAGSRARHSLAVSCDGDPTLRKLAHRWYAAAPPDDALLEFHPARQPVSDPSAINFESEHGSIAFSTLRFALATDVQRHVLDVTVHGLPGPIADTAGWIALDSTLGEEGVEQWLGAVEWSTDTAPEAAVDPLGLRAAVAELAAATPSDQWTILQGMGQDGEPIIVTAAMALKPVVHPLFDELVELEADVPADGVLGTLQDHEEALSEAFSNAAVHAASVTTRGVRTALVYIDADTPTGGQLERWGTERGYRVRRTPDPAWEATRAFR